MVPTTTDCSGGSGGGGHLGQFASRGGGGSQAATSASAARMSAHRLRRAEGQTLAWLEDRFMRRAPSGPSEGRHARHEAPAEIGACVSLAFEREALPKELRGGLLVTRHELADAEHLVVLRLVVRRNERRQRRDRRPVRLDEDRARRAGSLREHEELQRLALIFRLVRAEL